MTGRHVHGIEAWNNVKGLEPTDDTLLDDTARAGYRTVEVGRSDYRSGSHSLSARITAWLRSVHLDLSEKEPPHTDLVDGGVRQRDGDWEAADEAVDRLAELAGDTPFLLKVGFSNPHPGGGYRTTPHHLERVPSGTVTVPPDDPLEHPVLRKTGLSKNTAEPMAEEKIRAIRRHYLAMVGETDAMVGRILDGIEECGLREDTVVVFFSDHGDMQMEHRQWLKNAVYEGSARVPLIVAGPGVAEGHRVRSPVSLLSLRRTLADLGGYEPVDHARGRSLVPALSGEELPAEPVLCQYHSNMQCTGSFMLRDGDWKYVAFGGYDPQLFNLREDPDETENLAPERPDVVERLDETLRGICDYPDVDRRAKADDRACFRAWRRGVDREQYRRALRTSFNGVTDAHEQQIEDWLEGELDVQ